jgi:hypothetical protein
MTFDSPEEIERWVLICGELAGRQPLLLLQSKSSS